MRISFIVPFNSLTGGIRVVYEHANRLAQRGHSVVIYCPFIPYLFGASWYSKKGLRSLIRGLVRSILRRAAVKWFDLKVPFLVVPWIADKFIEDGDIVIATAWPTAYSVVNLNHHKGEKVYFIQDYEIWSGPKNMVDNSYKLPLHKIVISQFLAEILYKNLGVAVIDVVPNGINFEEFYVDKKDWNEPPRILMLSHLDQRKGVEDGIKALEIVKSKFPKVRIVMYGWRRHPKIPKDVEFHLKVTGDKLKNLYASCDIFLCPSRSEGFHLPPMEAMAAKCAVVATNVGWIPYWVNHGETALVCAPGDFEAMSHHIIRLIEDKKLRERIANAGQELVKQFNWDKATERLEVVLMKIMQSKCYK